MISSEEKKRKYVASEVRIFPRTITRKLSFLYQEFHIFRTQENVLPLNWEILELQIYKERLYMKSFLVKTLLDNHHERALTKVYILINFTILPRFRVVFLCLFTTSCFAERGKELQFDSGSWTKRTHTASEFPSHMSSGSTKEQLISFEY